MKIKINFLLPLIFAIFLFGCKINEETQIDFYKLNFKDSLVINVTESSIHSKALLLNDSVVLYKTSRLIYESHNPKWLFAKTKNKELFNNRYIYSPDILDISVPYKLIKLKKSNIFQVLKDKDTLNFDFENFEDLDYFY